MERRRHAAEAGDYRRSPPLHGTRNRKFESISLQRRVSNDNLYAAQPDFLYSVSRDFMRNCRTPMLVLPDDVPGLPLQTSIDVGSLAPNPEITVYP